MDLGTLNLSKYPQRYESFCQFSNLQLKIWLKNSQLTKNRSLIRNMLLHKKEMLHEKAQVQADKNQNVKRKQELESMIQNIHSVAEPDGQALPVRAILQLVQGGHVSETPSQVFVSSTQKLV